MKIFISILFAFSLSVFYAQIDIDSLVHEYQLKAEKGEGSPFYSIQRKRDSLWPIWSDAIRSNTLRIQSMKELIQLYRPYYLDSALKFSDDLVNFIESFGDRKRWARALVIKAEICVDQNKPAVAIELCERASKLYHDDVWLSAKGKLVSAKALFGMGDDEQAKKLLRKSLFLFSELDDRSEIATVYNAMGLIFGRANAVDSALYYFNQCKMIADQTDDQKRILKADLNIGQVYNNIGNQKIALQYFIRSSKQAEKLNEYHLMSRNSTNIAFIYQQKGEYKKALGYFEKSLELSSILHLKEDQLKAFMNIGQVYIDLGDLKKAKEYLLTCKTFANSLDDQIILALVNFNLGKIYEEQSDFMQAKVYYLNSDEIAKKESLVRLRSIACFSLGRIYLQLNNDEKAIHYFKLTRAVQNESGLNQYKHEATLSLYKIYKRLGNIDKSLKMHELYLKEKDEYTSMQTKNEWEQYQIEQKYLFKHQNDSISADKAIAIANAQNRANQETLKRKNIELQTSKNRQLFLYIGISLMGLFSFFIWNRLRLISRQNIEIENQKNKNLFLSQKILEQDQQLILGETAKTVAHELNSPLGAIKAGAEGVHDLVNDLVHGLIPKNSKENIVMASRLSKHQEVNSFLGLNKKKQRREEMQEWLNVNFDIEETLSAELNRELCTLNIYKPEPFLIDFLLECPDRNKIYELTKTIGNIHVISANTVAASKKSAHVVSSVREALDYKTKRDSRDIRLQESVDAVTTIVEASLKEKGSFENAIEPHVFLNGVDESKIFQLWYNLIAFMVDEASQGLKIVAHAVQKGPALQISFEMNQSIVSNTLNEHHYDIIMDAKRDSNDLRMGIVKHLLSEHKVELYSNVTEGKTRMTMDFPI